MIRPLQIKKSPEHGKGVFAQKPFKKGAMIFVFSNTLLNIQHPAGCDCTLCRRCIQWKDDMWLVPRKGSFGWYLNHSCEPSCKIQGKRIIALHSLAPREEITIDYSTTTKDASWSMHCKCNSQHCRKQIRSIQFLPPFLRRKYASQRKRLLSIR